MTNQDMHSENMYKELCTSYRAIDDFRQKLLGILPLASSGILTFLIDPKFLGGETADVFRPLLPGIGLLGFLVTLGLFFFEIYGIRRCTYLILVGEYLECELGMKHGQFRDRPPSVFGFIAEPMAAGVIYPAVMAAWSYMGMYFYDGSTSTALPLAASVFMVSAGLMVLYQKKLAQEQNCWKEKAKISPPATAGRVNDSSSDVSGQTAKMDNAKKNETMTISTFKPEKEFYFAEGCYILETYNRTEDEQCSIVRARVLPGKTTKWHAVKNSIERYVILEGTGVVEIGKDPPATVGPLDVVVIPAGVRQPITNSGQTDLIFLAICTPRFLLDAYVDLSHEFPE